VETALNRLLGIRLPAAGPAGGRPDAGAARARRDVLHRLVGAAAAFLETLDGAGAGELVRERAGLVGRRTAPGTPYDDSRVQFIRLFGPADDLPFPPPGDDFGTLRDEHNTFLTFPACLRLVGEQTAEYVQAIPGLKATREYRAPCGDWPDPWSPPPGGAPSGGGLSPRVVGEAWAAALHGLELEADREHFWGCHLILLCHEASDPARGHAGMTSWLYGHLERDLGDAVEAVQGAAAALVQGWRSTLPPAEAAPPASHADDFRWIVWYGETYTFTPKQAACVGCLWNAWEREWPGVAKRELLMACDTDGSEVKDLFKGHPAWKKVIVRVRQGLYCLRPPRTE
jgi:hypothetical protein